ncbi:MAG TPA: DUF1559 domain-containing protein, partial [Isosphaeraceae bacterium]
CPTPGADYNQTAREARLAVFLCPSDEPPGSPAYPGNSYRACTGSGPYADRHEIAGGQAPNGLFYHYSSTRIADIRDGASQTASFAEMVVGQNGDPSDALLANVATDQFLNDDPCAAGTTGTYGLQGWFYYYNLTDSTYNHTRRPNDPRPNCYNTGRQWNIFQGRMAASSRHPGGVNLLLADGSVRFVKDSLQPDVWRALASRNGREVIGADQY